MAFDHFDSAIGEFMGGNIDLLSQNIKVVGVDLAQAPGLSTTSDSNLSDIPAPARIATSGNLTGKIVSGGGIFDADGTNLGSPAAGDTIDALVYYVDSGLDSTSTLLAMIDNELSAGLPTVTNGRQINFAITSFAFSFKCIPVYNAAAQAIITGNLDLLSGNFRWLIVDNDLYVGRDDSIDEFLSDVTVGARVAESSNFSLTGLTRGFSTPNTLIPSVSGGVSELVILYKNTGVEGTSRIIARFEGSYGLPITPIGGGVVVETLGIAF